MTLSENILRARTGAQAPEPEMVREYARTLLMSFIESPNTWAKKINQDYGFLQGTAKEIRPKKEKEWGSGLFGYSVGDEIKGNDGKTYRVTGGDPNNPDIEEVVNSYANGGVVDRPQMAMVGEQGREFIVPENKVSPEMANELEKTLQPQITARHKQTGIRIAYKDGRWSPLG